MTIALIFKKKLGIWIINNIFVFGEKTSSYKIPENVLLKVAKYYEVEKATDYLLGQVFSSEELATHSLTGEQSNANKSKGITEIKRPQIDQEKLQSVKGKNSYL